MLQRKKCFTQYKNTIIKSHNNFRCTAIVCSLHVYVYTYIYKCNIYNTVLGPYDFRDAENADGITESSHKNRIYSLTRNVTEFVKV